MSWDIGKTPRPPYPGAKNTWGFMTLLIAGLCLFIGIHLVPCLPALRAGIAARIGERSYKVLFSVGSLAGLALIVLGYRAAPVEQIFTPSETARAFLPAGMAVAFVLLANSQAPGHVRRLVRHPMLAGVLIWSGLHFLANGDLASNILFGAIALWAVIDMLSAIQRGKVLGTGAATIQADAIATIVGLIAYGLVLYFHATLFGVAAY